MCQHLILAFYLSTLQRAETERALGVWVLNIHTQSGLSWGQASVDLGQSSRDTHLIWPRPGTSYYKCNDNLVFHKIEKFSRDFKQNLPFH